MTEPEVVVEPTADVSVVADTPGAGSPNPELVVIEPEVVPAPPLERTEIKPGDRVVVNHGSIGTVTVYDVPGNQLVFEVKTGRGSTHKVFAKISNTSIVRIPPELDNLFGAPETLQPPADTDEYTTSKWQR